MIRRLIGFGLLIVILSACSNLYHRIDVDASAPSGFQVSPLDGIYGNYKGVIAIGPRNTTDTHSPSIVVVAEPDLLLGGSWVSVDEVIDHIRHSHTVFNDASSDNDIQILEQSQLLLDGELAKSIIFQRTDTEHDDRDPLSLYQHYVVVKRGSYLYTISYTCEQSVCDDYKLDYEQFLAGFSFR